MPSLRWLSNVSTRPFPASTSAATHLAASAPTDSFRDLNGDAPSQPVLTKYPQHQLSAFNPAWYRTRPWLEYSVQKDCYMPQFEQCNVILIVPSIISMAFLLSLFLPPSVIHCRPDFSNHLPQSSPSSTPLLLLISHYLPPPPTMAPLVSC